MGEGGRPESVVIPVCPWRPEDRMVFGGLFPGLAPEPRFVPASEASPGRFCFGKSGAAGNGDHEEADGSKAGQFAGRARLATDRHARAHSRMLGRGRGLGQAARLHAPAAVGLGYLLAKSRTVERLLAPYIVASQSIPIVAIAPLLIIWFGPGRLSKVLICALIVFFPVLVNTIVGVRSAPEDLRELMRSLRATRWQTFAMLEAPAAMPVLLGGLKIGATLSVIGAVVGEFVGADEGLGFLVNVGRGLYDTALVFVAVLVLILLALSLYGLVAGLERRLHVWREAPAGS